MMPIFRTIERTGRNMSMHGQFMPQMGHARVCLAEGREGAANASMGKEQWKTKHEYIDCGNSSADDSSSRRLGALLTLLRADTKQLESV